VTLPAWVDPADVAALPVQSAARLLIVHALSGADEPHLKLPDIPCAMLKKE
jgi:hypothetical protein